MLQARSVQFHNLGGEGVRRSGVLTPGEAWLLPVAVRKADGELGGRVPRAVLQ
jgi:hypothetical protein